MLEPGTTKLFPRSAFEFFAKPFLKRTARHATGSHNIRDVNGFIRVIADESKGVRNFRVVDRHDVR